MRHPEPCGLVESRPRRRRRDSNPRYLSIHTISSRAQSATLAPLLCRGTFPSPLAAAKPLRGSPHRAFLARAGGCFSLGALLRLAICFAWRLASLGDLLRLAICFAWCARLLVGSGSRFLVVLCAQWLIVSCGCGCGEGGIRTPGTLAGTPDFESGAIDQALPPLHDFDFGGLVVAVLADRATVPSACGVRRGRMF